MVRTAHEPKMAHRQHAAPRTALVTGAATGIGAAIASTLADSGLRVFRLDRRQMTGGDTLTADLTDTGAITAAVTRIADETPEGLGVLVNNAGVIVEGRLADTSVDALDLQIAVNLRAPFLLTQALLAHLRPGSTVINIASELAFLGRGGASAYAATKGAMLSLTRSWARELAPDIRVNAVAPGPVDTALLGFDGMSSAEKAMETANPMGRIGRPEEIAAVVDFLASPAASFITGQCYSADGGAAMH